MKKLLFLILLMIIVIAFVWQRYYNFSSLEEEHSSCNNNYLSEKMYPAIKQIAEDSWYISPEYLSEKHEYFFLRDSMDIEDLRKFTNYTDPLVRTYSFTALIERQDSAIFRILLEHIADTSAIEVYAPGHLWGATVIDEMINVALKSLSKQQRDYLRDLIIFKHNYLETTTEILSDLIPCDKYYDIVKELARQDYDVSAYVALATYQRQEDIPLIKNCYNDFNKEHYLIFKPIDVFPDTAFFHILLQHFDSQDYKYKISYSSHYYYIRALAQYQREECLDIFRSMSKNLHLYYDGSESIQEKNKSHILQALKRYYCPLYEELYKELDSSLLTVAKLNAEIDEKRGEKRNLWWQ